MSGREIFSKRVLATPRAAVWEAATNPDLLAQWWGPAGFTNTFDEFDLRAGGAWRLVMHGPDGTDYKNESVFLEVAPPERIVFDHVSSPRFRMTITFTEQAAATVISFSMLFESVEACDRVKGYVVDANEQNFDRLAALLEKRKSG